MISIKKADVSDSDQVAKLFDAYRVFYHKNSDIDAARNFILERIRNSESEIYVAELAEKQLVGFVQLYPLFSSTRMKRLWLLNDLFVDVAHRGKNISIQLIDRAKQLAIETNACGLLLETAKTNEVGNKLYPRTGFNIDQDQNYYSWNV